MNWLERILNAHDAADYADERAARLGLDGGEVKECAFERPVRQDVHADGRCTAPAEPS